MIKLAIVLLVIGVGAFYVNPANWHPFAPFGWPGFSLFGQTLVGQDRPDGAAAGHAGGRGDHLLRLHRLRLGLHARRGGAQPAARRAHRHHRLAAHLHGALHRGRRRAHRHGALRPDRRRRAGRRGLPAGRPAWAQFVISIGAVAGITSVLLVLMLSQPRVLLAMARDGLLPPSFFGAVHPRFRTPWKSTILTGAGRGAARRASSRCDSSPNW